MKIREFLTHHVVNYAFKDLEVMAAVEAGGDGHGGVVYPMVSTCVATIELLGLLSATGELDSNEWLPTKVVFNHYWKTFLYPDPKRATLGEHFYQVVRNGLQHTFTTKGQVFVDKKGDLGSHFTFIGDNFHFDVLLLAKDLKTSYNERFTPWLDENEEHAQNRLDSVLSKYRGDADKAFEKMKTQLRPSSGPSGPTEPNTSSSSSIGATGPAGGNR